MRGTCLCGDVEFKLDLDSVGVVQCHCSLCRKQGGSASNSATFIPATKFHWVKGEQKISQWQKPSGFRADFCSTCGSPVPNPLGETELMWVPVGLIDGSPDLEVVVHIYTDSMASWDPSQLAGNTYADKPSFEELVKLMHEGKTDATDRP